MNNVTLAQLGRFMQEELYERVIPFWLRHAPDTEHGGLVTCLDETGQVLSTDKYLWSQTRALWVFSTLAQRTGDPRFLQQADSLFTFCDRHGRNARGEWVFRVARDGSVLEDAESIYTDGFAMLGLAAHFTATRSPRAEALLRETCASVRARLAVPGSYGIRPYEIPPGTKVHGISMLFSLAFWEAGHALGDDALIAEAMKLASEILECFYSERHGAIREFLLLDNRDAPGNLGTCCLPGHSFESMWALIRMFRATGRSAEAARCAEIIRSSLEKGWDDQFGGIFLAIDLEGQAPYWPFAEYKPWWPAVEAMYALLLAYRKTHQPWCLNWYERVHNYAFTHYPVRPDGEWRNRLDRQGRPVTDVIALPVKDPFHLPRALILATDLLMSLADGPETLNIIVG